MHVEFALINQVTKEIIQISDTSVHVLRDSANWLKDNLDECPCCVDLESYGLAIEIYLDQS